MWKSWASNASDASEVHGESLGKGGTFGKEGNSTLGWWTEESLSTHSDRRFGDVVTGTILVPDEVHGWTMHDGTCVCQYLV